MSSPESARSTDVVRSTDAARTVARVLLGAVLVGAGVAHLTFARDEFLAQVPTWMPIEADLVVVVSGVVEVGLGAALAAVSRWRVLLGWATAAFFITVFPGNISQLVTQTDAFGLDSDAARTVRLVFQPVLVLWALWSSGAWRDRADRRAVSPRSP